jgi:photosystem II stability/assembly factor-like uncharacterized protein
MMEKRWFATIIALATAITALLMVFWLVDDTGSRVSNPVMAAPLSLSVTAVDPAVASNDVDSPLVIQGIGFTATLSGTKVITAPTVTLGDDILPDVIWVNTTTLSATVPWGLTPQVYTLTVVNPDGISATLTSAFTVTDGFGEITTGGPYGGNTTKLFRNPDDPDTLYALMFYAGTFVSTDAGENWAPLHDYDIPQQLAFDAQNSDVLYLGGDGNTLERSKDGGGSWTNIVEDFRTQNGCFESHLAAHPVESGWVYFGMGSCGDMSLEPGEGGVYFSKTYGDDWETQNTGLTDLDVQSLAIHPVTPTIMAAGTFSGNLFYSIDGGDTWTSTTQLTGTVSDLYFNPYKPLEAWALTRTDTRPHVKGKGYLYRSTNLTDWTVQNLEPHPAGPAYAQMEFLPGSVWLASQSVYSSTDSGATWNALPGGPTYPAVALAISPDNPDIIHAGTDHGIEKSADGGLTWQDANQGLAALIPGDIAVSPDDVDTVWVRTYQDIFYSQNGGDDWVGLDNDTGGPIEWVNLASDPFSTTRLYLSAHDCPDEFCIQLSTDGGLTWDLITRTIPTTYTDMDFFGSHIIAPSPHTAGEIMVGCEFSPPEGGEFTGVFCRSTDHGLTWTFIEPPQSIDGFDDIVYDAVNPDLIYAGTAGTGLWRSEDGGDDWVQVPISDTESPVSVAAIAVHPNISEKLYVRTYSGSSPNPEPELWVSEDAGDTWEPMDYVFTGVDLLMSPPISGQLVYALYTGGSPYNLYRSYDDGNSWQGIAGAPRPEVLVAASDGERSILYIGSPGGLASQAGAQTSLSNRASLAETTIFGSGVYRLTTRVPDHWIYLPLVLRGHTP